MKAVRMNEYLDDLNRRYPVLVESKKEIFDAYQMMRKCYQIGGKLLIAGNGGSSGDSEHIAGEIMKRFQRPRPIAPEFAERLRDIDEKRGSQLAYNLEQPLMAIPLVAHESLVTAYMNDVDSIGVFAQQLLGYGRKGDVFLGISTSGNSQNILNAAVVAKALEVNVIALTGRSGGELADIADIAVKVPEDETYKIQELHLPVYHCWCMMLEEYFFGDNKGELWYDRN